MELAADTRSMIAAFSARKYAESGSRGLVVANLSATPLQLHWLTIEEIAGIRDVAMDASYPDEALAMVVHDNGLFTDVIPRETIQ